MTFTDQTEIFSDILASKRFPSYELFRQALEYFTKISGSKFSKGKTSLHRPGSLNRDILLYRSAEFQCSSKCEACFVIGCKKGHLFVIRYHMVHNHSIDYQVTPSPNPHPVVEIPEVPQADVDLTVQFNAHFPSLKFSSYDDLMEALTSFQKRTGSVYVKKGVHKLPTGHANSDLLVYSTMCFQCIHYGTFASRAITPRNHRSKKIGCLSAIHVSSMQHKLHITRFNMRHNHLIYPTNVPSRRKDPISVPLKTAKNCGLPCVRADDHPSLRHLPLLSSEYYEEVIDVDQLESKEISPVRTLGVGISSYSSLSPFPLSKANDYEGSQRRTSIETMLQCIRGILAKSDISAFEKRTSDLRRLVRSWEMDPIVDPERSKCRPNR
uniref:FAR1 DNA-binding domain n=2 Tax=Schistocephalus solidus TaxID=70667 RepID=A0A0X3NPE3_SCHSO